MVVLVEDPLHAEVEVAMVVPPNMYPEAVALNTYQEVAPTKETRVSPKEISMINTLVSSISSTQTMAKSITTMDRRCSNHSMALKFTTLKSNIILSRCNLNLLMILRLDIYPNKLNLYLIQKKIHSLRER